MDILNAFKSFELLNEDAFDITDPGLEDAEELIHEDEPIEIIDEDNDEVQDSYIDKIILECDVCHSLIYKDREDIIIEENSDLCNEDEECPYCKAEDGYKIVGKVAPFEGAEDDEQKEVITDDTNECYVPESARQHRLSHRKHHVIEHRAKQRRSRAKSLHEGVQYKGYDLTITGTGCAIRNGAGKFIREFATEDEAMEYIDDMIKNKDINESISSFEVRTDDDHRVAVETKADGGVFIETDKPMEEEELPPIDADAEEADVDDNVTDDTEDDTPDETIVPVQDTDIDTDHDAEETDVDVDDFDEESFDDVAESYLKKHYSNVASYITESVIESDAGLKVNGCIKFKSGKKKNTQFILESGSIDSKQHITFNVLNEGLHKEHRKATLLGRINNKTILTRDMK